MWQWINLIFIFRSNTFLLNWCLRKRYSTFLYNKYAPKLKLFGKFEFIEIFIYRLYTVQYKWNASLKYLLKHLHTSFQFSVKWLWYTVTFIDLRVCMSVEHLLTFVDASTFYEIYFQLMLPWQLSISAFVLRVYPFPNFVDIFNKF